MKKWYVITGILALLLAISLGTCSINSALVGSVKDELASARDELASAEVDSHALTVVRDDLASAIDELADTEKELADTEKELAQLKSTKEINFGNGLRVFDIEKGYYEVRGKVQNVTTEPLGKVVVIVAFYNAKGELDEDWGSVDTASVYDLFPQETAEWEVHFGSWTDQDIGLFGVYAIGNMVD